MDTLSSTAGANANPRAVIPHQPPLATMQDNLIECHNIAGDLENIVNRLLGARPEKPSDLTEAPDGQVNCLVVTVESLRERLVAVHSRLSQV